MLAAGDLEAALTKYISFWYSVLNREDGPGEVVGEWQRRSSYFSGKNVRVRLQNEMFEGVTDGLEENGALRVKTADGSLHIVQAGDVERLRTA
jgi:BirA family biotin operon repressor/biotin-[acetyl-CoA-carboxylase] ligase